MKYDIATNSDAVMDKDILNGDITGDTYTEVSFNETVINRLDNILTANILSCCFLFLLFFYSIKHRR